jgi:signal transduction histidine kinase
VRVQGELNVNDRLAAEVFQLVNEGLSNVRRHTNAKQAIIRLERIDSQISLSIENDNPNGNRFQSFTPRSITERATALGGEADVRRNQEGHTVVSVMIPV